jgi:hypothetical protein
MTIAYRRDLRVVVTGSVLIRHTPTGWIYRYAQRSVADALALLDRWTEDSASLSNQFVPGGLEEIQISNGYVQLRS